MPPPLQPVLIMYLIERIKALFLEKTSWAEIVSAIGAYLYSMHLIGAHFFSDDELNAFPSLTLILNVISIEAWITLCLCVSILKFSSVLSSRRSLKLFTASVMFFWLLGIIFMTWQVSPWAPTVGFIEALCAFQPFFIARHIRDWDRPIAKGGR
jgi:hypothetical protein